MDSCLVASDILDRTKRNSVPENKLAISPLFLSSSISN